jgi:two-component system, NarL family, sensor histidine kinase UhpB
VPDARDTDMPNPVSGALLSEEQYRLLIENSNDLFYMLDPHGVVTFISAQCARYGYSPGEVVGRQFGEFVHPDDRERVAEEAARSLTTGEDFVTWFRLSAKDGTEVYVEDFGRVFLDGMRVTGIGGALRDITQRRRAQSELEQYRAMVASAHDPIFFKDLHGRYQIVNQRLEAIFGLPVKEIIGKTDFELMPSSETARMAVDEDQCVFRTGRPAETIKKVTMADGRDRWYQAVKVPQFDSDGRLTGLVGIARDLTEVKRAEERLVEYQQQLRSLAAELVLAQELERRRIARELHDHVGQNLALMKMRLDALAGHVPDEQCAASLREVKETVDGVIADVRGLMFQISPPILYELGFAPAVEWLVEQVQERHGLKGAFEDDGRHKPMEEETSVLVFQSVRELLMNVVRHARARSVKVRLEAADRSLAIFVEDDGAGFDPAAAASAGRSGGFGLFSVRERLNLFGGSMEIDSAPGRGTRVTLRVPFKTRPQSAAAGKP